MSSSYFASRKYIHIHINIITWILLAGIFRDTHFRRKNSSPNNTLERRYPEASSRTRAYLNIITQPGISRQFRRSECIKALARNQASLPSSLQDRYNCERMRARLRMRRACIIRWTGDPRIISSRPLRSYHIYAWNSLRFRDWRKLEQRLDPQV